MRNRYLTAPSGRDLASTLRPRLVLAPLVAGPVVGALLGLAASLLDAPALGAVAVLAVFGSFMLTILVMMNLILGAAADMRNAAQMWLASEQLPAIALCQKTLARVFRSDLRLRAYYILGLCAEANGDFGEAYDLFLRAYDACGGPRAFRNKHHAQCLLLSHAAIAATAARRLDDADRAVREASALFPALASDGVVAARAVGQTVSAALRDLEPGRDPRALLALASLVVLSARGMGREAVELANRERYFLNAGLMPRERALCANAELRVHGQLAGGPMRTPGVMGQPLVDPASQAWAERILPTRG